MIPQAAFFFLVICFLFPVTVTASQVYVWRNENGELVFSDSPRSGAEVVKHNQTNDSSSKKNKANNIIKKDDIPLLHMETSFLDINPEVISNEYEVVINQPKNNATIRDNTGSLIIRGGIKPFFKQGYRVQLYIDDKTYKKPQTHSLYSLHGISRGEHQIKIILLDENDTKISTSKKITFYMHRAGSY